MCIQREIWVRGAQIPNLYGAIQRCTSECVRIFWIKCDLHNIMGMTLKNLSTQPALVPIPKLYKHVIIAIFVQLIMAIVIDSWEEALRLQNLFATP